MCRRIISRKRLIKRKHRPEIKVHLLAELPVDMLVAAEHEEGNVFESVAGNRLVDWLRSNPWTIAVVNAVMASLEEFPVTLLQLLFRLLPCIILRRRVESDHVAV